ncbi:MAG: radical SAM protein, partial [Spirochaetota bacterium]
MEKTGLYIHIPFCRAKCDYCSFYSVPLSEELRGSGLMKAYAAALIREIESRRSAAPGSVDTVFFGGGSPSYLDEEDIASVFDAIRRNYTVDNGAEITMEINPCDCTEKKLSFLAECGVNRFSLGVQTLNEDLYSVLGRKGGFCSRDILDKFFSVPGV